MKNRSPGQKTGMFGFNLGFQLYFFYSQFLKEPHFSFVLNFQYFCEESQKKVGKMGRQSKEYFRTYNGKSDHPLELVSLPSFVNILYREV